MDKVAFTGSVPTGRAVYAASASIMRPATMELGGKSALIVFDDVDIDKAVEWAMVSRKGGVGTMYVMWGWVWCVHKLCKALLAG